MHFVDHMQKKYITGTLWKHSLCSSQKLEFIMFLKTAIHHRFILMLPEKILIEKTLVKLRISNHKLNIETGRYSSMTRFRDVIEFILFVASR